MFQKLIVVGNLGRDPESGETKNGKSYARFTVAVNTGYGGNEQTTWWRVTVFGAQAEACAKYLSKGRTMLIETDTIETHAWVDEDGEARSQLQCIARRVQFLGGGNNGSSNSGSSKSQPEEDYDDIF